MLTRTYVNELLKIVVKIRQIILSPLVVRNELLLPLQQLLSLILQPLSFCPLVVYPRKHERVFVIVRVIGELGEEVLFGGEGELLVLVAFENVSIRTFRRRVEDGSLVALASSDLILKMPLFIVQVL